MVEAITRRGLGQGAAALAGIAALGGARPAAAAPATLTFQANWVNDPEFIGYMVGIDNGLYKEAGLDVKYLPGGPDMIPEGSLLSGKSDIALTTIISTVKLISEKSAPLKIIGTQFQKSPLGVISLASSKISGPKDLVGKTVACPPLSIGALQAVLLANQLPKTAVRVVPYNFDPTPLVNGTVDAIVDFVTEIPFLVEQKGKQASSFLFWDTGLPLYIDLVVVTETTLKTRRPQLLNFLRASRKGWAINNAEPKKYVLQFADTWFKGNGSTLEAELYHNTAQIPLMANPKGLYVMDPDAIQRNLDALGRVGIKGRADMFDGSLLEEL